MQATKKSVPTDLWEAWKAQGIQVRTVTLHQASPVFRRTEKTISDSDKYIGIQMWWCPAGLLMEWKGKQCIVPQAGVASADV